MYVLKRLMQALKQYFGLLPSLALGMQKRVLQALKQYVVDRIAAYPTTQQQDEAAAAEPATPW